MGSPVGSGALAVASSNQSQNSGAMPVIAILDDRVTNRDILAKLAASLDENVLVQAFGDPVAALEWLGEHAPDLIITDYKMPAMDGAAFIAEVRRRPSCTDVPIIVVTVYEDQDFRYKALEAGATDFLLSPFDHYEFKARASNLLMLRKQQQIIKRRATVLEQKLRTTSHLRKEQLRESDEKLRLITNSISAMICVTDRAGTCIFVNEFQADFFGADAETAVGFPMAEVFGKAYAARHTQLDDKVFESGEALDGVEETYSNTEGERRTFQTTKTPLFDAQGRVVNVVTVAIDITERKLTERALQEAKEQAEAGNRIKTEFLASMSHELRTPLNAVIGFADIMRIEMLGPIGNPRYKEYSEDIRASAEHLLAIIDDLLDVSTIEAGRLVLKEEVVKPEQLLRESLRVLAPRATEAGVELRLDCRESLPVLRADARRLKQILISVLSNGVAFTPKGGRVTLSAVNAESGGLRIIVIDTGHGMAESDIPLAKARFGRIETAAKSRHSGAGLGLPLAIELARLHGGRLDISSRPGEGTTVTIDLPPERCLSEEAEAGGATG